MVIDEFGKLEAKRYPLPQLVQGSNATAIEMLGVARQFCDSTTLVLLLQTSDIEEEWNLAFPLQRKRVRQLSGRAEQSWTLRNC